MFFFLMFAFGLKKKSDQWKKIYMELPSPNGYSDNVTLDYSLAILELDGLTGPP